MKEKTKKKANAITKWFEDYDDDNVKRVVAYFCWVCTISIGS